MKDVIWVGTSKDDLMDLPAEVRTEVGHALYLVQIGRKPLSAKPMQGFGGASVLEIREDFDSDTYRVIYTVRFEERIYVLHSFKKQSSQGIKTSQRDLNVVNQRLKIAEELHREWQQTKLGQPTPRKPQRRPKRK